MQEASATGDGDHAKWGLDMREHKPKALQPPGRSGKGPINEVVCGAMMLAYERAGKWEQVGHCFSLFVRTSKLFEI